MKIAIVSDTHNNMANFKKAIEWINKEKIRLILHCGDISSQETIDEAKKLFKGEIKFVKGNADHGLELPEKIELEIEGNPSADSASSLQAGSGQVKIAFCHFPDNAKKMAQSGQFDLVFYGHTHRPWDEKIVCPEPNRRSETHMINPGELAGQFYKPTFAVYDTVAGILVLKILERI